MKFLAIKGFRTFQHYHKRGAPWIKLYSALLSDSAFLQMPEAAQAQLMKLWLLASQMGHPLPNNAKLLAGGIRTLGRFHLDMIIEAGFLIPTDESDASNLASTDASKPASNLASARLVESSPYAPADARSRERREERVESRETTSSSSAAERELAHALASDADRSALGWIVQRAKNPTACVAAIAGMRDGLDVQKAPSIEQLGTALRDYAANGETWNAAHFRAYLGRAMQAKRAPVEATNGKTRNADPTIAALDDMIAAEKAKLAAAGGSHG